MPTQILLPYANGAHGTGWTVTGSNAWTAVSPGDPIAHDEGTTRISAGLGGLKHSLKVRVGASDFTTAVPLAKTIVSVTFFVRIRPIDIPSSTLLQVHSCSASTLGNNFNIVLPINIGTGSFVDYSKTLPHADGGDWTPAKCDDIQIRIFLNSNIPGGAIHATSMWVVIEYAEAVTSVLPADETARRLLRRYRDPEPRYILNLGPRAEQIKLYGDFTL